MRKWILLLLLLLLPALPVRAQSGALTVDLSPYRDVPIHLYAVAEQDEQGNFTFTQPFAGCGVELSDPSAQTMTYAAGTLAVWALEKEIPPTMIRTTDAQGRAIFESLRQGVYLVTAEPFRRGMQVITPNPFLVYLPTLDGEKTAHWFLTAQMKCTVQTDDETSPNTGTAPLAGMALLLSGAALFLLRNREKT